MSLSSDLPRGTVLDSIGNTPLYDLSRLVDKDGVRLLGKAELCNPGGSVKDRPALSIIRAAIDEGSLTPRQPGGERSPGKRILDATSGNTGIAYAMIGAALGIGVTLCLPKNASVERHRLLRAYGAEVIETDPLEGSDGAIRKARELAEEKPELYVYVDQYGNDQNWLAHYRTTGPEIWQQTEGQISHFVTGLGTSGTFMGTGRFLREKAAAEGTTVELISVEPDSPFHGLEGMKHMASAIVPPIYDQGLADRRMEVATERAYEMVGKLGKEHGLLVGISAGANVFSALEVARQLSRGTVVTILCDGAARYLSDSFWEELE